MLINCVTFGTQVLLHVLTTGFTSGIFVAFLVTLCTKGTFTAESLADEND